jgi:hypothetical protein
MAAADDQQQPVQALRRGPCGHSAPRRRSPWALGPVSSALPTLGAEHVVEAVREFRVVVAQHEANLSSLLAQDQRQVAGLRMTQRPLGLAVTPAK